MIMSSKVHDKTERSNDLAFSDTGNSGLEELDASPTEAQGYDGSKSVIKRLYGHESDDDYDDDGDDNSFAIVHRLETKSVEVKSPRLRSLFDEIFKDYPNWYHDASPYTFYPQFKPIFHRWESICNAVETQTDETTKRELRVFCDEMKPILAGHLKTLESIKATRVVSFGLLWMIFAPGELVYGSIDGEPVVYRLRDFTLRGRGGDETYWKLKIEIVDWNGSYTGFADTSLQIMVYREPRAISKLSVCPLQFASNPEEIKAQTLARGRKFEALRGFHVKFCEGNKCKTGSVIPVSLHQIPSMASFPTLSDLSV